MCKESQTENFIQLLRRAIGNSQVIPKVNPKEWPALYKLVREQSLVGIMFEAIADIRIEDSGIPAEIFYEWLASAEQIDGANKKLNRVVSRLTAACEKYGFKSCILKGQGNALMYPSPEHRMPGDIDIWLSPGGKALHFVRLKYPKAKATYHHIDAGLYDGVEVEVHYRPSYRYNLLANRCMQRWFKQQQSEQFANRVDLPDSAGEVSVPTKEFNLIYQLSHISNHLTQRGIGMRHMVDYYYLLKSFPKTARESERETEISDRLKSFGLWDIAGAVMWVLKEVLGLEEKYLIAPVDERRGRFLLSEIMQGGNFGMYGTEKALFHYVLQKEQKEKRASKAILAVRKNIWRLRRDARLVRYFPSECLWEPVFRVYHFGWRLVH